MKQFTIQYSNVSQFENELNRIRDWAEINNANTIWIQSYVTEESDSCFAPISETIERVLPDAKYIITHCGLAFSYGEPSTSDAIVVCNLFEKRSTKLEMLQYDFNDDNSAEVENSIIEYVNANPWIKLISINTSQSLTSIGLFSKFAASINPDIAVSGGAAITRSLNSPAMVLSSAGTISSETIVLSFIGGDSFHAKTDVSVGWKGIGKEFTITKSEGALVSEIDGVPAFDLYKKYFKIDAKPGIIVNETIEFPLCLYDSGLLLLRCPFMKTEDGGMIMMMNDLFEGKKVRLSFGSPEVILDDLAVKLNEFSTFEPQVVSINSCIGRLFFWGDNIHHEISLFQKAANSSGYLTGGEIIRVGDRLFILNETNVITAMREGSTSKDGLGIYNITRMTNDYSLTHRLATFIDTVTSDLEEYSKIIERLAITDELTGLNNRREIENIITQVSESGEPYALIMLDLDNFKQVNDNYGHVEGDNALKLFSAMIQMAIAQNDHQVHAARWGGDEFLLVYVGSGEDNETVNKGALALAQEIQKNYNSDTAYEKVARTVSIGIAPCQETDNMDELFQIADEKLYQAKAKGKRCIVI